MKRLVCLLTLAAPLLAAQPKKVVVLGLSETQIRELQAVSADVRIVPGLPPRVAGVTAVTPDAPQRTEQREALLREVADADAFIGGPTAEVIRAGKKLKWVQILSAGVEQYRYPELIKSDIVVTNARIVASPGIADHGFAMLLALTRKLNHFIPARTEEDWQRKPYGLEELWGKTAVVIGMGGIGSHVSRRAWAFGLKVIGVDTREFPPNPMVERYVYPDRLDQVLPLADVVFVCAPETPETTGMFGERQFSLMKKSSYFIALSRGPLYDLDALVAALQGKRLAGAGVDVTEPEPLPKGHPLWKFPNVILTPHIATQCDGETPRRMELLKENVGRFARGERLVNVVDKEKGY